MIKNKSTGRFPASEAIYVGCIGSELGGVLTDETA